MSEKVHDNKKLCQKIKSIFPDIGECGIDVDVEYDKAEKAYLVHLKKGGRKVKTHLETKDADLCMEGKQCVGLGIQIAQFRD